MQMYVLYTSFSASIFSGMHLPENIVFPSVAVEPLFQNLARYMTVVEDSY